MDKRGRNLRSVLRISIVLTSILFGIFAEGSWVQAQPPTIVSQTPEDNSTNVLINTVIRIQFSETMNITPGNSWVELEDEYDRIVPGTIKWVQTTVPNDTLIFTLQNALKPATGYSYEGNAQSGTGGVWFNASFLTKHSLADATPPEVQTTYPYTNMTGFPTTDSIYIKFSESMNPGSITNESITLAGPGIIGTSGYSVNYSIWDGEVEIEKDTPFLASNWYTVTVTTNVRDVRGNPLKNEYSFSFQAGGADGVQPWVTQTIPVNGDTNVSLFPNIYAIFSEEIDEDTLYVPGNITIYDNTAFTDVPVNIYWSDEDFVSFGAQSGLTYNHNYTVTIGTGVKDFAGNSLILKTWSFTTALNSSTDTDPIINWGLNRDEQIGQRFSDGINPTSITKVSLGLGARDDNNSNPLNVTATTPGHTPWTLDASPGEFGGYNYSYETGNGNENLTAGLKTITFTIQDGGANTVTFTRDIYIFNASPTLTSPTNGATGVSTTPTFTWSYGGSPRPLYYQVAVFDGPDMNQDRMVWVGTMVDRGAVPYSITIPTEKRLSPNKTYYWGVKGGNRDENGETYTGLWPFTTGGTPPPAPRFERPWPRSEDIYPPALQGRLSVFVFGPSPADIVELKVTGPGGFQYIFTEDDLSTSESLGQYFSHSFTNPLSDGTYTFSVTDSAGRTVTVNKDFTYAFVPRVTTMLPVDNTYVNTTTPTLSWVSPGAGVYYRVIIFDWNNGQAPVYASDFIQDTSIIIPSGVLFPNASYNWRVDVFDAPYGSNSSRSNTLQFSTGPTLYTPNIVWGCVWNENSYYAGIRKFLGALVLDTLPDEVSQLRVTGPGGPYDFTQSYIVYHLSIGQGNLYGLSLAGPATDGNYTFNLQTPRGPDTYGPHGQTSTTITIVDQSLMVPANNAYISSLTPTLSWTALGGGPWNYRVMIMDWRNKYTIYTSATSTNASTVIPDGVLEPNRSYMWRVEVYDNANTIAADNRSTSGWNALTTTNRQVISDLVVKYYNDILDRDPAGGEEIGWIDEIERIASLGIDINEGFIAVGKSFFNSAEYLLMAKTNAAYVEDLYETFLQRLPVQAEIDYWVGYLTTGMSRNILLYYFVYSAEFKLYMEGIFGMGGVRPENNLVNDLYRGILNRLPDTAGFNAWIGLMRAAQCQGAQQVRDLSHQIALAFIQSGEYILRARTNSEYVGDLYDAILRRGALPAEVSGWEALLNAGAPREQVLQGFTDSPEFQLRVTEVINAGCL